MDLAAISAFVVVGNRGGFRAAALALGVTSAAVSKAVARLEAELGVTLVARTTRSVRLTPAGALFHHRCQGILDDLERAARDTAESAALPQGRLVVSMTRAFGRTHVVPAIAHFARTFPQVEVEARFSDRPINLVADGADLAVRIGKLPDSSLIAARVGQTSFVMCSTPEYLSAAGTPRHPDDLARHAFVGYVSPDTAHRFAHRFMVDGEIRTLTPVSRVTVDDGEALVAFALQSLGLVMANDYLMEPHLANGALVRVLAEYEMPPIPISVVHPPTRNPSAAARAFIDVLRRSLSVQSRDASGDTRHL